MLLLTQDKPPTGAHLVICSGAVVRRLFFLGPRFPQNQRFPLGQRSRAVETPLNVAIPRTPGL